MYAATTTIEPSRFAGLVRRYCACGELNACRCGLPRPNSGWTVASLSRLREAMHDHGSVQIAAAELGDSVRSCNIALNALLGRSPVHALAALEVKVAQS